MKRSNLLDAGVGLRVSVGSDSAHTGFLTVRAMNSFIVQFFAFFNRLKRLDMDVNALSGAQLGPFLSHLLSADPVTNTPEVFIRVRLKHFG